MTDRTSHQTWLRTAALAVPLFALAACGAPADEEAASEPAAQSTDWVETDPAEPAVPVDLPEVEMTNVPAEEATPAPTP